MHVQRLKSETCPHTFISLFFVAAAGENVKSQCFCSGIFSQRFLPLNSCYHLVLLLFLHKIDVLFPHFVSIVGIRFWVKIEKEQIPVKPKTFYPSAE